MSRSWWIRFWILVFFVVTAFVHVYPTVAGLNLETTKFPFKKKVNLGLDLQGGLYMVYGVDFRKVYKEVFERFAESLVENMQKEGITVSLSETDMSVLEDPKAILKIPAGSTDAVREKIKKDHFLLRVVEPRGNDLVLALSRDYRGELKEKTLSQSVEVVRNRIDEFGVSEPVIATKGDNQIMVELPGVKDVERAKALVGRTARLEFKIENASAMSPQQLQAIVHEIETKDGIRYKDGEKFSDFVEEFNKHAKGKIPADSEIDFERSGDKLTPYLLFSKVEVSGNDLQDARVSYDQQNNRPIVSFQMNPRGAMTFAEVTAENVHKRMAIILDGVIHSAPVINEKIPGGSGQITLGGMGDNAMKEARDLSIVLRAGALPAPLELFEQRVIGPSLGRDSIQYGVHAALVGSILIFIFMLIYYRLSGVVAVGSLILNIFFMLAILIGMDATLTLPGIAGLALTIGMAVDSNVIIFERIRDELLEGKSPIAAIHSGFEKAFACIFDANITHAIVAVILMNIGSGPIRGFAVTLLVGIITTLFCSVTVAKLCFDAYISIKKNRLEKISI